MPHFPFVIPAGGWSYTAGENVDWLPGEVEAGLGNSGVEEDWTPSVPIIASIDKVGSSSHCGDGMLDKCVFCPASVQC